MTASSAISVSSDSSNFTNRSTSRRRTRLATATEAAAIRNAIVDASPVQKQRQSRKQALKSSGRSLLASLPPPGSEIWKSNFWPGVRRGIYGLGLDVSMKRFDTVLRLLCRIEKGQIDLSTRVDRLQTSMALANLTEKKILDTGDFDVAQFVKGTKEWLKSNAGNRLIKQRSGPSTTLAASWAEFMTTWLPSKDDRVKLYEWNSDTKVLALIKISKKITAEDMVSQDRPLKREVHNRISKKAQVATFVESDDEKSPKERMRRKERNFWLPDKSDSYEKVMLTEPEFTDED